MTKRLISAVLALAMLLSMTACGQDSTSEPTKNSSSVSDSSQVNTESENSSESTPDSSSDSESENTTTTSETTTTTTTTTSATTTTKNSTTTTTTTQATTTTKNTTKATQKPVVQTTTTKYVAPAPKNTTTTTAKKVVSTTTTTKAAQPAVNTATYVNNIIADINKMFPESQFNKTLYDKFERLCKGVPTSDDLYQIKEQLCNFAIRKYNGKKGTFTYYYGITPSPRQDTVKAAKPISITIDRTLGENDAQQNNGAMVNSHYSIHKTVEQNYNGICLFIKKCYCMADSGIPSLVKRKDNKRPEKTYNHRFYIFISNGYYNSTIGHNDYYLWFVEY